MWYGTEVMIREALAERIFLDPEVYNNDKAPPTIDQKTGVYFRNKYNQHYQKIPQWFVDSPFQINIELEEQSAPDALNKVQKTESKKYYVKFVFNDLPSRDFEYQRLSFEVRLVDLGGHYTLWTMENAASWIQTVVQPSPCRIYLSILKGEKMAQTWKLPRREKVTANFNKISLASLTAKAQLLLSKVAKVKPERQTSKQVMMRAWAFNLTQAARFGDAVRAKDYSNEFQ